MDGMEEKLNSILGNPEMMRQIMNMAQSLGGQGAGEEQSTPAEPSIPSFGIQPAGLDPAMLSKLASVMQRSGVDSHQQALLGALRPYLSHERLIKLEKAMRAAKLAGVATSFLGNGGLSLLTGR